MDTEVTKQVRLAGTDLATAKPFALGPIAVDPPARRLTARGRAEMVEPRVMRVLVALGEVPGQVHSRDQLIEQCWDGQIVTDNAVTRVISLLRHALADVAGEAVKVETIAKVGFRLLVEDVSKNEPAPGAKGHFLLQPIYRSPALAAAGTLVAVVVAILGVRTASMPDNTALASIQPLAVKADDKPAEALSQGLSAATASYLVGSDTPVELADDTQWSFKRPSVILRGSAESDGSTIRASFTMVSARTGDILWTGNYARPVSAQDDFREQLAMQLAHELHCAYADGRGPFFDRDEEFAQLSMAHCEAIGQDTQETARLSEQIVRREPGFARGWAEYAVDTSNLANSLPPEQRPRIFAQARARALHTLMLDPRQGLAYAALSDTISSTRDWVATERIIDDGLRVAPDIPELHAWRGTRLAEIGRISEARDEFRNSFNYGHFLPGRVAASAVVEAQAGDLVAARGYIATSRRYWPQSSMFDHVQAYIEGTWGDPAVALRLLSEGEISDDPDYVRRATTLAAWRLSPTSATRQAAIAAIMASTGSRVTPDLVVAMAKVGGIDAAYRLAGRLSTDTDPDSAWFRFDLAAFRADHRFMPLMARFGIAQTWLKSDRWPDFCRSDKLPYECRSAAIAAVKSLFPNA